MRIRSLTTGVNKHVRDYRLRRWRKTPEQSAHFPETVLELGAEQRI